MKTSSIWRPDKVVLEVPAPAAGVLKEIKLKDGHPP